MNDEKNQVIFGENGNFGPPIKTAVFPLNAVLLLVVSYAEEWEEKFLAFKELCVKNA